MESKIAIIGGGIIGLALGYKLSKMGESIDLFEKENNLAMHQTGNNSGVIHCGVSYQHGTLKSQLSINGSRQLKAYCDENNIRYENCGKIIVANTSREKNHLDWLLTNGNKAGLLNLRILNKDELRIYEPYINGESGLLVPDEGITSYKEIAESLGKQILSNGSTLHLGSQIKVDHKNRLINKTQYIENSYKLIIIAAGVHSDYFLSENQKASIVPFRGEYYQLKKEYEHLFNNLVYPTPNPNYPFLGVHLTRTIDGKKLIGPNAILALAKNGYNWSDINFQEFLKILVTSGLWRFVWKNPFFSFKELYISFSRSGFVREANKLNELIQPHMIEKSFSGVRAQSMLSNGDLDMDFNIQRKGKIINIFNAPSPGASASLSIADYIIANYTYLN